MSRTILVSNRLPWTLTVRDGQAELKPSSGGLATALAGTHGQGDTAWIGWPGDVSGLTEEARQQALATLRARRLVPLELSANEVERYYEGFSNGVLWPMFHYLLDKVRLDADSDWDAYVKVNERFAAAIAEVAMPGDRVWIHDYQLMLVPKLLREQRPELHIGFFLHIPFPTQEVFRILPWREPLLQGLLAADLLGFHTDDYLDHFRTCAVQLLGADVTPAGLRYEDRQVRLASYAIGIDGTSFNTKATEPPVRARVEELRRSTHGRRIVLGIDRLDYTKGIPRRLLAFERYMELNPGLAQETMLLQVAVPSRQGVPAYAAFRRQVDEIAGRINGRFGSPTQLPVHLLHQAVPFEELVALYAAADVMLVTPLRDGMNLVAKEFCAARPDEKGVLVLSEFAGAAAELKEALLVNPYDIGAVAATLGRALELAPKEAGQRMRALRRRVFQGDVHHWAASFMSDLEDVGEPQGSELHAPLLARLVAEARAAHRVELMLDYDGTLVPFTDHPDQATPDPLLLQLLGRLTRIPGLNVHIVSGRTRDVLEHWLGGLPLSMHAEHGFWTRLQGESAWRPRLAPRLDWMDEVIRLLESWVDRFPGSHIEHKVSALAWHHRQVRPAPSEQALRSFRSEAGPLLERHSLEWLVGDRVVELRMKGIHKGTVLTPDMQGEDTLVVAIGDDRTDEDLFAALPPSGIAIRVGQGPSRAAYRVASPHVLRNLLGALADALEAAPILEHA